MEFNKVVGKEIAELYLRIYCEKTNKEKGEIIRWLPVIEAARLSENIDNEKSQLMDWINCL